MPSYQGDARLAPGAANVSGHAGWRNPITGIADCAPANDGPGGRRAAELIE